MSEIGLISYLLGSVSHLALAIFLLMRWGNRTGVRQFLFTILFNSVWAAVLAYYAWSGRTGKFELIIFTELFRTTLWILLIWRFLYGSDRTRWPRETAYKVHGTWLAVVLFNFVALAFYWNGQAFIDPVKLYISGPFILAIVGFLLIYQFYSNSSIDQRWQVKFFSLGVGGLFVYDLFVFSLGMLFQDIERELWYARGIANTLIVPLIAISIVRMKAQSTELALSRKIVFYSTGMLGVGFYLVAMAAGGYFIQRFGGSWGTFALIVFLFSAILALLTIMFSGQARARLRVFLDKNFFHYRYDYRKEWLNLTQALSDQGTDESVETRALRAVCDIVQSPGGTLWQRVGTDYTVRQAWNLSDYPARVERSGESFCTFLKNREWIIDKEEYERDPELYGELVLPDWYVADEKAWLVLPLLHNEDLIGFIVLAKSMAIEELTWEDRDLLKSVGRQVAGHLALHRSAQKLAETRQFEAYNRLVAFMMHDLKNLIAQQSLVVRNAAKHKDNPEFVDDVIVTVDNSVARMNRLLDQLKRGDQGGHQGIANVGRICKTVVEQTMQRSPCPTLLIEHDEIRVKVDEERFTMVLGHLVRNAQDAAADNGTVTLFASKDQSQAIIEVRDTGSGMDPEFVRTRLFVPFDTTKGAKGMGIGVYQAREFAVAAGGQMQVESVLGEGSTFRLCIPLMKTANA